MQRPWLEPFVVALTADVRHDAEQVIAEHRLVPPGDLADLTARVDARPRGRLPEAGVDAARADLQRLTDALAEFTKALVASRAAAHTALGAAKDALTLAEGALITAEAATETIAAAEEPQMAVRQRLARWLVRPLAAAVRPDVRSAAEGWLSGRTFATRDQLDAVAARLDAPPIDPERLAALEAEVASLKKRLSMAMGALQAATAQLQDAKKAADDALALANRAQQAAERAKTTAASALDGANSLILRPAAVAAAEDPATGELCAVPGCGKPHRARGYCAKHYQQWKRGQLEAP